jgi:hypothetical protein
MANWFRLPSTADRAWFPSCCRSSRSSAESCTSPSLGNEHRLTYRSTVPARRATCRHAGRRRREHHRLLGNGYGTRPPELDCAFESICETCTYFHTNIKFRPTLQRQRDHAADHDQAHRVELFDHLLRRVDQAAS